MDDWTIPPALLPNLTDLDLSHNRSVTDEELARCSSLRTLDLNCHFPPMTGTYFANMPELRVLRTWGQAGTGIHLSKLTKLEELYVFGNASAIRDEHIAGLTTLKLLHISENELITPASLKNLTNLESLSLFSFTEMDGSFLSGLKQLTHLETGPFAGQNLPFTQLLPSLRSLSMGTPGQVTDATLSAMTELTSLRLPEYGDGLTEAAISTLTNLTELDMSMNYDLTGAGLKQLTNLKALYLNHGSGVKGEEITHLTNLKRLGLVGHKHVLEGHLAALPKLTFLDLGYQSVIGKEFVATLREKGVKVEVTEDDEPEASHDAGEGGEDWQQDAHPEEADE